jgi:hypothetical protein
VSFSDVIALSSGVNGSLALRSWSFRQTFVIYYDLPDDHPDERLTAPSTDDELNVR